MWLGDEGWTIEELAAAAALALSRQDVGQASARVTSAPNPRTIRYYGARGLLDPPVRFRGRTAVYGTRHLTQLVAIKKLQAQGASLLQVQRRLTGLDDTSLSRLAGAEDPPTGASAAVASPRPRPRQLSGIRLHENVTLMLEQPARPLDDDDLQAIAASAAPLLKLLQARRVL